PHSEAGWTGGGAGGDLVTLGGLLHGLHVVADVEGAGAERAGGLGGGGGGVVVAAGALERGNGRHFTMLLRQVLFSTWPSSWPSGLALPCGSAFGSEEDPASLRQM